MMENVQPILRFPEFKTEWKNSTFEEEFSIFNGYAFKSIDSTSEGARWIKIADVDINKVSHDSPSFLPIDFIKKYDKFILKEGDYVVALTRPILNKKLKIARIDILSNGSLLNQRVGKIITKNLNSFIYYYIQRDIIINLINDKIAGNDPPNLSPKEISNIIFNIPSLPEQTKIADFLGAVDKQLELLNTKKEKLQLYKKGVMQKLFSQEIRFTKEDGTNYPDWEEKSFENIFVSIATKKNQIKSSEYLENGAYPVVDQGQKFIVGYSNDENKLFKTDGSIIFGDHTTILKFIDFDFIIGADGVKVLQSKSSNHIKFLYYCLCFNNIKSEGYKRHFSILKELKIFIPHIEEQNQIADFLTAIDNQIEAINNQIIKTENYKKGLLQQMFV